MSPFSFLIHVHLLNWGFVAVDELLDPRPLVPADLYIAVVFSLCYLAFYLAVLDRNGHHFYIILSPRTHFCAGWYTLLIGLYVAVYKYWPIFDFLRAPARHVEHSA